MQTHRRFYQILWFSYCIANLHLHQKKKNILLPVIFYSLQNIHNKMLERIHGLNNNLVIIIKILLLPRFIGTISFFFEFLEGFLVFVKNIT
jgi:hypothetical protein